MEIVKIRKVGNSNTMSIPRKFVRGGYREGQPVIVEQLPNGALLVTPVESHRDYIRSLAREVVEESRETLEILAAHDGGEAVPADSLHPRKV